MTARPGAPRPPRSPSPSPPAPAPRPGRTEEAPGARLTLRASFPVHTYEVDAFAALGVPALAGYLQEVAALHADELGVGLDALRGGGLTWMLARQRIEVSAPPRLGDVVEVETWPAGIERLFAVREFVVRRAGEEVARATTHWLVIDVATRRPVRPSSVLDPRFPREVRATAVSLAAGRLPEPGPGAHERRFEVRHSDIDTNLHVTSSRYLGWAVDAVPVDLWRARHVAAIEVHYLAEAHPGAAVVSRAAPAGELAFAHAIVREEDGKELARLATAWAPRGRGGG